ncbi:heat shock 70 kDa protein 12B-like [Saccostrea cucullata]|uniref:heat shock 70 kDa protein 12B-like n=1 Tax=Saccostrea cuccullata TaxID=36930 RepID=UPI002ED0EE53
MTDWFVVAAIDFGTTYSGYAFSFRSHPNDIHTPQTWCAGSSSLASLKAPTCLLLNPDKSLNSFGYEAQDKYVNLVLEEKHRAYFYFERFKMTLHQEKNLSRRTTIEDILGRTLPAIDVFGKSIKYLKNHFLTTLKNRVSGSSINDVLFVLTVPAIWRDSAKEIMREAALNAGIPPRQITLALEPEAASIMCQNIPNEDCTISLPGTQYLIADIGGGTGDFTVHEILGKDTIKEISKASGGAYGGINVDLNFLQFLQKVMGVNALRQLKNEEMEDYLDLLRDFEIKKRTVTNEEEKTYVVKLSASFNKFARDNNPNFQREIKYLRLKGTAVFLKDKLKIDAVIMRGFFENSINDILDHIKTLLERYKNVKHILLVGGYGECTLLQEAIRKKFRNKTLIVPQDCGLAVVKGAVLFGHKPERMSSRILRYSYFTNLRQDFDPSIHDIKRKAISDFGDIFCKGSVLRIIAAGTAIDSTGLQKKMSVYPLYKDTDHIWCEIFYSEKNDLLYDDSEDCKSLGTIRIPMAGKKGERERCKAVFTFGLTSLQLKVMNSAGKEVEKSFDLLE